MSNVTSLRQGAATTNSTGKDLKPNILKHEINIADAVTAGLANAEYIEVWGFPAGTVLRDIRAQIVTNFSLGAGARLDLGDAANASAYVNNATTLTADTWLTQVSNSVPAFYSSAGSIRLKVTGGTIATGKIRLVATVEDYTRKAPTTTNI